MSKITIGNIVFEDWADNSPHYQNNLGSCKKNVVSEYDTNAIYIDIFTYKIIVSVFPGTSKHANWISILTSMGLLTEYDATQYTVAELRDKVDNALMKVAKMQAFI